MKASLYDWASKKSHTEVESYLADFQQIADLFGSRQEFNFGSAICGLSLERFEEEAMRIEPAVYQVMIYLVKLYDSGKANKATGWLSLYELNRGLSLEWLTKERAKSSHP